MTYTQKNSKRPKGKFVFAIWEIETLPHDLDEFHISCGTDDDNQSDGYFIDSKGAKLLIEKVSSCSDSNYRINYRVKLICPSLGLQRYRITGYPPIR